MLKALVPGVVGSLITAALFAVIAALWSNLVFPSGAIFFSDDAQCPPGSDELKGHGGRYLIFADDGVTWVPGTTIPDKTTFTLAAPGKAYKEAPKQVYPPAGIAAIEAHPLGLALTACKKK